MTDLKQPENVGYFSYLCSLITNVARGTHNIKSKIVMAKAAANKKTVFARKLETSKVLHLQNSSLWC
jgi:hypothetical protein